MVTRVLDDRYGRGTVPVPSQATFYRLVHQFAGPAGHPRRPACTLPSPTGGRAFTPTVALRPGEQVQVGATRLDVLAVFDDGTTGRPELTLAVDVATRVILAAVLRPSRHQGRGGGPAAGGEGRPPPGPPDLARRPAPGTHPTPPVSAAAGPGRTARGRGSPAGGGGPAAT
ncbi:hypothetical protein [Streptomyces sp. P9-2]|uniref:hypothetical protein n=1 Tax=Streptomyces sp. P9-2 TaxID=3423201 RepID=UPI003F7461F2